VINENLPDGYEEGMQFGMIGCTCFGLTLASYQRFRISAFQLFPCPSAVRNGAKEVRTALVFHGRWAGIPTWRSVERSRYKAKPKKVL
jgi:hypothetical protein